MPAHNEQDGIPFLEFIQVLSKNIVDKTAAAIVPTIAKINYLLKKFIFPPFDNPIMILYVRLSRVQFLLYEKCILS